ncbi:MAG: quinone-interacting membrane-bound oxidoreductase complex subunit QmoC, partial [Acidobacteria bacterium]|nr:quinone-interacting membrane-bound oxidoreductase complex subunit QmoC [Acidobacteriota bacterium]
SVICPISTDDEPFPRKEMVWVQWGLKDRLMADATVWLCHQCSICNTYCPRDAKPADLMAAVRDYSISHFAVPAFMGQALAKPKYLPLLFAVPILIFLSLLAALGNIGSLPEGEIVFSKFFPIIYIEAIFIVAVGAAVAAAFMSGKRYWKAMHNFSFENGGRASRALIPTVMSIFKHVKFRMCEELKPGKRESFKSHLYKTHTLIFYGFLGLVITTTSVGIGIYAFGYLTPWPLWHPVKILGNVSGVAVIIASVVFMYRRLKDKEKAGKSTYSDWLLLSVLALTTITGFLSQLMRLADAAPLAYWSYFTHLVFIFFLLVYIPYSKFAHLSYRFVAMLFAASKGSLTKAS